MRRLILWTIAACWPLPAWAEPRIVLSPAGPPVADAAIEVAVYGLEPARTYWVTIVPAAELTGNWKQFFYVTGKTEETLRFDGLPAGRYEARLH